MDVNKNELSIYRGEIRNIERRKRIMILKV
jgi:hypothetical protein